MGYLSLRLAIGKKYIAERTKGSALCRKNARLHSPGPGIDDQEREYAGSAFENAGPDLKHAPGTGQN